MPSSSASRSKGIELDAKSPTKTERPGDTCSKLDNGEPVKYDPTFNGPIKNRSCTDVICCILFIIFLVAFVAVGVWAFIMGDPKVLLYPSDSEGNICGYGDYEDKPYVFFFDLLDCAAAGPSVVAIGCPTPQVESIYKTNRHN